jgi:rubrerythrin
VSVVAKQLHILVQAMQLERKSYSFYASAAAETCHANAVRIYLALARDEMGHLAKLETVHAALTRGKEWPVVSCPASPFRECVRHRPLQAASGLANDSSELRVLDRGIVAESESTVFYEQAKLTSLSANSEALYEHLLEEEESHLSILMAARQHVYHTGLWFNHLKLALTSRD